MRIGVIFAMLALAGCASSGGFKPVKRSNPFPEREKLDAIEAEPSPTGVFDTVDDVRVPYWMLSEPLPDTIGPVERTPRTDLDEVAKSVADGVDNAVSSEPMHCLARQLGEFYLVYGGSPGKSLKRFMEHRCGVTSEFTTSSWTYWEQGGVKWSEANEDGSVTKKARESLGELAAKLPNPELGAWFGAGEERAVAMVVVGARAVDLEPMPMKVDGQFEVAGTFFVESVDIIGGVVNVGAHGWSDCHAADAKLPKFRIRCSADPSDIDAGFEVYTLQNGEVIASSRLWQRVWPSGVVANKFVLDARPEFVELSSATPEDQTAETEAEQPDLQNAEPDAPSAPEHPEPLGPVEFDTAPAAMRARMLERINELRGAANLKPVTLAEKQSQSATTLAPHYWGSINSGDRDKVQQIAFGLLAGWHVDGAIIDGSLYSAWVRGGPDDLVANLAARPGARDVLFGPDIATLSIGPHYDPESKVMGGLVHGWEFVVDESHLRRANRFLDHVTASRTARDNPKPQKVAALNGYSKELAAQLESGELQLHEVAYRLVNEMARKHPGQRTMVYYAEVHDPLKIELPEEILETVPLKVAVVVAPYQVPNFPWHTYGVVFAYLRKDAPTKVASAE